MKYVPDGTSNFPVLCIAPGAQRATAYISQHLKPRNKAYLFKDNKSSLWDNKVEDGSREVLQPKIMPSDKSTKSRLINI